MTLETTEDRIAFGQLLRAYRRTRDMTQRELARRAHVPVPHLCQVETGKRPCGGRLANRLVQALRLTDQAEILRFFSASIKTLAMRRRRTMARLQVTRFMRTIENQLQEIAGKDFDKILFLREFSVAGARRDSDNPTTFLVLDDGTKISVSLKVEKP